MTPQLRKRWELQGIRGTAVHGVCSRGRLTSQIALIALIITLEDAIRTYAQAKWKYGNLYLQKVREYRESYIVTIQEKEKNLSLFRS